MQTFLPYASFKQSAEVLDRQRLGKQRVEAKQIWTALNDPGYGWQNHPAVKMWRGYAPALALYGFYICDEWRVRGYKDSLLPWFSDRLDSFCAEMPHWLGDEAFHRSHQSNLIRKDPTYYQHYWPAVGPDLPYIWPEGGA